jgi:hypothetical protein
MFAAARPRNIDLRPTARMDTHCVAGQVSGVVMAHLGLLLSSEGGLDRPRRVFQRENFERTVMNRRSLMHGVAPQMCGQVASPC